MLPSYARPLPLAVSAGALVALVLACGGGSESGGGAKGPERRVETIKHEPCEASGHQVVSSDLNNDGKIDLRQMMDKGSGKEVCRVADLNHDGKWDVAHYFEADGVTTRRIERSLGGDDGVYSIDFFENGRLVRRETDTTGQHRIDMWDYFEANGPTDKKGNPKPVRRERDTTGDGKVDEWWVWDGSKLTVSVADHSTGQPDPGATVQFDQGDGGITPIAATAASSTPTPPSAPSPDGGTG